MNDVTITREIKLDIARCPTCGRWRACEAYHACPRCAHTRIAELENQIAKRDRTIAALKGVASRRKKKA